MNSIYKQSIKGLLLTVIALQLMAYTTAQEARSLATPLTIELRKARATWFESDNGAGVGLDSLKSYGSLELGYRIPTEFKDPQGKRTTVDWEKRVDKQLAAPMPGAAFPTPTKPSAMPGSTRRCSIPTGEYLIIRSIPT